MNEIESTESNEEKKASAYSNPLFQNLQTQEFSQENFPLYQKDMKNILSTLMSNMNLIASQIKLANIDNDTFTKKIMAGADYQCKRLEEYCLYLKNSVSDIPLPYQYLGAISHRFKSYAEGMHTIVGYGKNETDAQEKERYIQVIKEIAETGKKAISEYIDRISHIDFTDNIVYQPSTFLPADSIQDIIKHQTPYIEEKKVHIKNTIPMEYKINSYKEVFDLIMDNLISNAVKFSPIDGEIIISIEKEDTNRTFFSVQDGGKGIPKNVDVFAHGYTTPSPEGKVGTGLGLEQSKIVIDIINENISHKSMSPQGTVFTFSFPKKATTMQP